MSNVITPAELNEIESAILGIVPVAEASESVVNGVEDEIEKEGEESAEADELDDKGLQGSESDTGKEADEADGSEELNSTSGLPVKVQQRIDKITAEKGDLKTKIAEKDLEITALKQKLDGHTMEHLVLSPTSANPLTDVLTESELDNRVGAAKRARRWALQNINGAVVPSQNGGEDREYTEQEVRQIMANADELLTETAPTRRQFLKDQVVWDAQAKTVYPDLFDAAAPLYQEAVGYLKAMPELLRFPDFKICVGDFIEGRRLRLSRDAVKPSEKELMPKLAVKPAAAVLAPKVPMTPARGVSGVKAGAVQIARERVRQGSATEADQNELIGSFL